ncbi:MAG: glycosyltransferase [Acidobacteriota bacterium]
MVYEGRFGTRPSTIVLKYAAQWVKTARLLARERPDAVFVMTPPVVAALPAFWYAWRHRKKVVLDAHTAAFLLPRWRHLQWLQRLLCRRAATTLVSNNHLAGIVTAAGAHATVVPDVPVVFPDRQAFRRPRNFTVAVVCSFDYDEPVARIFEAAARLADVRFFVTGNPQTLDPDTVARITPNVTLTGFLSTPQYGGLLASADVVLVLTTFDHTMLRGAYEAIYQGTPVIVSDWPLLREEFPRGAVHVDNTPGAIVNAIQAVQGRLHDYRAGAQQLRAVKMARWDGIRRAIVSRLAQ